MWTMCIVQNNVLLGGVTVMSETVIERSQDRLRVRALSGNNLGQVVHTHVPLFIKQYNLVPAKGQ